jgi:hypothetical protein
MTDTTAPTTNADRLRATANRFSESIELLAAWSEQHPEISIICDGRLAHAFAKDREQLGEWIRALSHGAPIGSVRKEAGDAYAGAVRTFGSIELRVLCSRDQVCERIVVGTRPVEVPDPEIVAAAPRVTIDEEIVEWRCPESFLAG